MCRSLLFILFVNFTIVSMVAQTSVNSGGTSNTQSGGSLSFSIGEPFFTSFNKVDGYTVHQGIQYPFDLSPVSLTYHSIFDAKVYPNPFNDYLFVEVPLESAQYANFNLFDSNGYLIISDILSSPLTKINTSHLTQGLYIVQVVIANQRQVFKLIKK